MLNRVDVSNYELNKEAKYTNKLKLRRIIHKKKLYKSFLQQTPVVVKTVSKRNKTTLTTRLTHLSHFVNKTLNEIKSKKLYKYKSYKTRTLFKRIQTIQTILKFKNNYKILLESKVPTLQNFNYYDPFLKQLEQQNLTPQLNSIIRNNLFFLKLVTKNENNKKLLTLKLKQNIPHREYLNWIQKQFNTTLANFITNNSSLKSHPVYQNTKKQIMLKNIPIQTMTPAPHSFGYAWSGWIKNYSTPSLVCNNYSISNVFYSISLLNQKYTNDVYFKQIFYLKSLNEFNNLTLIYNFPYKSHLINLLSKTAILNEVVTNNNLNTKTTINKLKKNMINKSYFYSYYYKTNRTVNDSTVNIRNRKLNLTINYLYKYLFNSLNNVTILNSNQPVSWLHLTKNKTFNSKTWKSFELIKNQLNTNKLLTTSSHVVSKSNESSKKSTTFTFKSTLQNYIFQQNLIAMYTGRYYYWNTTEASTTLHARNSIIQTPFLLNWNEDEVENTLYLRPDTFVTNTTQIWSETKLLTLLLTNQYDSREKEEIANHFTQTLKTPNKFSINQSVALITKKPSKQLLHVFLVKLKKFIIRKKILIRPLELQTILLKSTTAATQRNIKEKLWRRSGLINYRRFLIKYLLSQSIKNNITGFIGDKREKMSKILKKKQYLLVDKHTQRKKNSNFYKKIVTIEFQKLNKLPLTKYKNIEKKKQYLKKHIRFLYSNKWTENSTFLLHSLNTTLNNFKNSDIKNENFEIKNATQLYDSQYRTFRSLLLTKDLSELLTNSSVLGDYIIRLVKHVKRNESTLLTLTRLSSSEEYVTKTHSTALIQNKHMNFLNTNISHHLLTNMFFLNHLLLQSSLIKYFLIQSSTLLNSSNYNLTHSSLKLIFHNITLFYFNTRLDIIQKSNLYPTQFFNYSLKRRLVKLFVFRRFSAQTSVWYFNMLIRFMEFCTGRKIYLKLDPHVENNLTYLDQIQCQLWEWRVFGFQKILGPKIFINESLRIILLALKYKDPTFLINWIRAMLYRMSFWKYRILFRYLKFVLKNLFEPNFIKLGLKGFKVRLKGKISVAGNARTRTLRLRIGQTSHSRFDNKIAHSFTRVNSFTGVMGFHLWIFF